MIGKYKVLIVDDEPAARLDLKKILNTWHTDFDVIAEVASTQEAWLFIQKNSGIDGIFLDIHIQSESARAGLNLAAKINQLPCAPWIIFISGYSQKPKDLIRVHPADYLLKPLEEVEVDRALEWIRKNRPKNPKPIIVHHYVINRIGEREKHIEYIDLDEVIYVEKNIGTNSIKIYLLGNRILAEVTGTIKDWITKYENFGVAQIHKSYLVKLKQVRCLKPRPGENEVYKVALKNCPDELPVGGSEFLRQLREKLEKGQF